MEGICAPGGGSARSLDRVEEIVNAYGAVLGSRQAVLLPDTLLPAPREQIKHALLIAAAISARTGESDVVQNLRSIYMLLADFVPPADAAAATAVDNVIAQAGTTPDADELAGKIITAASPRAQEIREQSVAEGRRLLAEFDSALGALQQRASQKSSS